MFGVRQEVAIEALVDKRARRRRRVKRLAVSSLLLTVLLPLCLFTALVWLFLTPEGLRTTLSYALHDRPFDLTFVDLEVDPRSTWNAPDSWRVSLVDVRVTPHDPSRQRLQIDRLLLSRPDLTDLWYRKELHFRTARVIGLHITSRQQRRQPVAERPPGALQLIRADHVDIWDANYSALPDPPLPASAVHRIYGTLSHVAYDPYTRKIDGVASLDARRFHTGTLELSNVHMPEIRAKQSNLVFQPGTLHWNGVPAKVKGTMDHIDQRAAVRFEVTLEDVAVEKIVENATGQPSPILGKADLDIVVVSGGELERGGGHMRAHVSVRNAVIPLPGTTKGIYKDVIRILPIVSLDERDRVHLDSMVGDIRLTRGAFTIEELEYKSSRTVQVRGVLNAQQMDLVVRLVPKRDAHLRPGLGIVLSGVPTAPSVRRAKRDELLPNWQQLQAQATLTKRPWGAKLPRWMQRGERESAAEGSVLAERRPWTLGPRHPIEPSENP